MEAVESECYVRRSGPFNCIIFSVLYANNLILAEYVAKCNLIEGNRYRQPGIRSIALGNRILCQESLDLFKFRTGACQAGVDYVILYNFT